MLHPGGILLAILSIAVFVSVSSESVLAQQSRDRGVLVGRAGSGPYLVSMHALPEQPRVGTLNFTVTLQSLESDEYITGADVEVAAINPAGEGDWLSPALPFPTDATSYVGNGEFDTAGEWTLEVRARGPEGEALVQFPLDVQGLARGGGVSAGMVFAVAMSVVVAGVAWLVFRARRIQRRAGSSRSS